MEVAGCPHGSIENAALMDSIAYGRQKHIISVTPAECFMAPACVLDTNSRAVQETTYSCAHELDCLRTVRLCDPSMRLGKQLGSRLTQKDLCASVHGRVCETETQPISSNVSGHKRWDYFCYRTHICCLLLCKYTSPSCTHMHTQSRWLWWWNFNGTYWAEWEYSVIPT